MVNAMYSIMTISYAVVIGIFLAYSKRDETANKKVDAAYMRLLKWVLFFLIQDAVWGIMAGEAVMSDIGLTISSVVFHGSSIITAFFWLEFVLVYIGDKVKYVKYYEMYGALTMGVMFFLCAYNFISPSIFYINEMGEYCRGPLRPVAFWAQYTVYLLLGLIAIYHYFKADNSPLKKRYLSVFFFVLAPIATGAFQFLYPEAPYHSIGYFIGCSIIHIFVVSKDHEEHLINISNMDELTGLCNRRVYEDNIREYPDVPPETNFTFISMDINGLKTTNDTKGHMVGDELIVGAADCMKRCFGSYGRLYRIGGDEFAAMIFVEKEKVKELTEDFDRELRNYKSENIDSISVSYGVITKEEYPFITVTEMARLADERMYLAKAAHYSSAGVDRRKRNR